MLTAISPVDGRYTSKTKILSEYFSEYALIKYRVYVEIHYFLALYHFGIPELRQFDEHMIDDVVKIADNFTEKDAEKIKEIEKTTNHDVKAVEYYIKDQFNTIGCGKFKEFVHFGLTSQDVNNTAIPLSLKHATEEVLFPAYRSIISDIEEIGSRWKNVAMLARTHGQPASPTRLGKEMMVYVERLKNQLDMLQSLPYSAKLGGATGNFNAHVVAYPDKNWTQFANNFVEDVLGLKRAQLTTQIEHYDYIAALFQNITRLNTILIDFCQDIWLYVSMEYFTQKTIPGEVGSSAMPHKVNPIDFENAEGNCGVANAIANHLATALPVSRLQRDLTDSTVLRNIGMPYAHTMIAISSIRKGIAKLQLNQSKIDKDLENNWMVISEAIQSVLRKMSYEQPYEKLKALTRGKHQVGKEEMHSFINTLEIDAHVKDYLKAITPHNYTGI